MVLIWENLDWWSVLGRAWWWQSRWQPVSVALADPHRDVGGFQGLVHDIGQVILDRIQVHRVLQPGRERGHGLVGVVAGPVEPAVHQRAGPGGAAG